MEEHTLDDIIKALTILRKYDNPKSPICCGHDELSVRMDLNLVSDDDIKILEDLGFWVDNESNDSFQFFTYVVR